MHPRGKGAAPPAKHSPAASRRHPGVREQGRRDRAGDSGVRGARDAAEAPEQRGRRERRGSGRGATYLVDRRGPEPQLGHGARGRAAGQAEHEAQQPGRGSTAAAGRGPGPHPDPRAARSGHLDAEPHLTSGTRPAPPAGTWDARLPRGRLRSAAGGGSGCSKHAAPQRRLAARSDQSLSVPQRREQPGRGAGLEERRG